MKNCFLILVLSFFPQLIYGGSPDGLALMKVETGARQSGMGGAFVSINGDANSSAYNPAGAVLTDRFITSFGYNSYWSNIRIESAYFASNFTDNSWLHGGIRFAAVNKLESRSSPTALPDALFDAYDISMKWGMAYRLSSKLFAGVSIGWFIEKIDIKRGSVFNSDMGIIYLADENLSFGASAVNIGSDFSLATSGKPGTEKISIPTTYRIGSSYRSGKYLGALDVVYIDEWLHFHAGVEADLHPMFSLRTGYMFNYDTKNYTAGATFIHHNFKIEYAFVPFTDNLGTSHLFNLSFTL